MHKVVSIIDDLAKRAEPFAATKASSQRDAKPLDDAVDVLRDLFRLLGIANKELRAELGELRSLDQTVAIERARGDSVFLRAPDAYFLTDAQGTVREANLAASALVRESAGALLGKSLSTIVDPDDMATLRTMMKAALEGQVVDAKLRVRTREASEVNAAAVIVAALDKRASLFFWRFRVLRETGTGEEANTPRDELVQQERSARIEQERANDAKDRLIALVSHDLRAPLNSILGWTEVLSQSDVDEDTRRKALATIERSGRAQSALIEDLLDMSRITAGKLKVRRLSVDLTALVRRAVDDIRPSASAKHLDLHVTGDEAARYVLGDPARLSQVLANLLGNAVKFTPAHGAILVSISTEEDRIMFCVRDNGCGIARDSLATIFEPFHQEDENGAKSGLGLGLYISKQIVTLHEGTLTAESDGENRGTLFVMSLPAHETAQPSPEQPRPALPSSEERPLAGLRVLIVDDDADTRELIGLVLRRAGATTDLASSVSAALQAFDVFTPNVVLSDIRMEGADGNDLIRALRNSRHADVPAIAVSADSGDANVRRSIDLGFDAYLVKPVDLRLLVDAVADAVGVARDKSGSP